MSEKKTPRREVRAAAAPARPFTLGAGMVSAIFALLVVLFFHEVFLGGKTFVSPDTTAPAGFVRMGEQSLWKDHVYPLWNPFVFLGMPSFGSGAYNPLIYPPDWPLALVQKVIPLPDMTWLLLYYFLGGVFLFLLAREWGARAEGALLAAVAFVFAPNLVAVGSHGHGSQLVDSAYLPLLLWLATRWLRRGSIADLGWLALAGGFQLLRGHVQICFYTWLAVAILTAIDLIAAARRPGELGPKLIRGAGIAAAAAVAFGISAFYSLPLRDYARWSIRGGSEGGGVGMTYATAWSLSLLELPTIVVPGWAGFGGESYWGGMPFTDYPNAYLGMIPVLLGLPAFFAARAVSARLRIFALVLGAFALFVAFGHNSPLYGLLYDHLPLFNKFRIPVMVLVLFQLAAALALAWGWTAVLDAGAARADAPKGAKPATPLTRYFPTVAALLVIALLVAAAGSAFHDAYVGLATSSKQGYPPQAADGAFRLMLGDLARAAILGLLAIAAAWAAAKRKLSPLLASAAVLVLLLVELLPVSGRVMAPVIGDPVARNLEVGRDDVVEFLEKAGPPGTFRILPTAEQSNRYAGFGIASITGYHAAKPRLFQDLQDAHLEANFAWMRLLNIRYIVTPQPLETVPPFLHEVFRGSQVVYENVLALPRVTLVDRYRVVSPPRAIIDSVSSGSSESANATFLTEDPKMPQGTMGRAGSRIVSYRLNEVTLETDTQGPAIVRLADLWYPDWVATLDGRPAPILRADYFLRGVQVPAGRHQVKFAFRSPAMRQGLTLSIVCAVLALGAIAFGLLRRPRNPEPVRAA